MESAKSDGRGTRFGGDGCESLERLAKNDNWGPPLQFPTPTAPANWMLESSGMSISVRHGSRRLGAGGSLQVTERDVVLDRERTRSLDDVVQAVVGGKSQLDVGVGHDRAICGNVERLDKTSGKAWHLPAPPPLLEMVRKWSKSEVEVARLTQIDLLQSEQERTQWRRGRSAKTGVVKLSSDSWVQWKYLHPERLMSVFPALSAVEAARGSEADDPWKWAG